MSTDIPRYILLAALVIVSLMLWNAWQKDHPVKVTHPTSVSSSQKQATSVSNQANAIVPISVSNTTQAATAKAAAKNSTSSVIASDDVISVKTDVLNVKIDTLGGNIVGTSLSKFPAIINEPNNPQVLLNHNNDTLYVAQSALIGKGGPDNTNQRAQYSSSQKTYELEPGQKQLTVKLNWQGKDGVKVTKEYIFTPGSYLVKLRYIVDNQSGETWTGNLYTQLTRKEPPKESHGFSFFDVHRYMGAAISSPDKRYQEVSFKDMREESINKEIQSGWAAMVQQYFVSAWVPPSNEKYRYYSHVSNDDAYTIGMVSPQYSVDAGKSIDINTQFYNGPEITSILEKIAPGLKLTVNYGFLWPIAIIIFSMMQFIYNFVGNWGWAIIIVTLLIKLIFYPLATKSYRSMANMRKLQPKMKQIRERYADDKQKQSQAMMELYKKEKANPLGSCLPMIVQIPVFFALYMVLLESVQLRQAPWIGWIHDLSVPDPYYILPIIMGITMLVQTKLNPPPPDPTQAKLMLILPVVFTVLFVNFPAGLVLYWTVNSIASVLQQWYVMRSVEKADARKKSYKKRK